MIENLALRQQVTALKQQRPRPPIDDADRGFWVALRSCWSGWMGLLVIVKPATVVKWHKERFRRYWTTLSNRKRRVDHDTGRHQRAQTMPHAVANG